VSSLWLFRNIIQPVAVVSSAPRRRHSPPIISQVISTARRLASLSPLARPRFVSFVILLHTIHKDVRIP
jgi:hypothetical protein